jgi:hypothetical protein
MLITVASVILLFGLSLDEFSLAVCKRFRYQTLVESASLAVAADLSKIIPGL